MSEEQTEQQEGAATRAQHLTFLAISTINDIVKTLEFEEAHAAIAIVRRHLEARAEQTAPRNSGETLEDLLGV